MIDCYGHKLLGSCHKNYLGVHRVYLGVQSPGGTLHIGHIDPMIEQKNAGIGLFFGVKTGKIPVFRVIF